MQILVTGGAASGKSAHAERLLCARAPEGERLYVATMQPFGEAAAARIARHRALRAGRGFETVERQRDLAGLRLDRPYGGVLLECIPNLLANEMFDPAGWGLDDPDGLCETICRGVESLAAQCGTLVVVTGELGADGMEYPSETAQYRRCLAQINRTLAARASAAAESVCGILVPLKGEIG